MLSKKKEIRQKCTQSSVYTESVLQIQAQKVVKSQVIFNTLQHMIYKLQLLFISSLTVKMVINVVPALNIHTFTKYKECLV